MTNVLREKVSKMTDEQQQPVKPTISVPPSLSEFRKEKAQRFNLKKIILGFVFASAFITALDGSLVCVPFSVLALWMAQAKTE